MGLTTRERDMLDLERGWWLSSPTKERAIRDRLGCSPAAYYAALRRLSATREAYDYDPLVVLRLRRRQARRRRERFVGPDAAGSRRH